MTDVNLSEQPEPSAASAENQPAEQPWLRLHPLSPLLRGGIVVVVIAGILLSSFRDSLTALVFGDEFVDDSVPNESDLLGYLVEAELLVVGILVCLGFIVLFVGLAWVGWRFHTYRITDDAVEQRTGVLFRQHRRAPLDRIQSVNLQRPLLARLIGLTQLEVQTAGQDGKVTLNYLGFTAAKSVREDILRRSARSRQLKNADAAQPAASAKGFGAAASQLIERRAQEIIDVDVDSAAYKSGAIVSVPAGRLVGSILLGWGLWVPVLLTAFSIWAAFTWNPFMLTLIIPAGLITVAVVFSEFNRGFRFTLSSTSEGVRIGAGLTSTTTESIPFGRIHAIEARQPIGWRLCGWWKVRITTAGHSVAQGGQNKMQNLVLPVGSYEDVERVFAVLLPGLVESAEQRTELREGMLGKGAQSGYVPAGSRSPWVLWFGARRASLRVAMAKQLQLSTLRIRRGWFTKTFIVMPLVRAQSLQISRPLVQRFLGLATISAHTVLGPVQVYMRGLDLSTARAFFSESTAAMIRAQQYDSQTYAMVKGIRPSAHYRPVRLIVRAETISVPAPVFVRRVDTATAGDISNV